MKGQSVIEMSDENNRLPDDENEDADSLSVCESDGLIENKSFSDTDEAAAQPPDEAPEEADIKSDGSTDILIQGLEDVGEHTDEAEPEDEGEKFYCARCEREVPEYVTLCYDCEARIRRYPFSSNDIFLFIIVVFISLVGLVTAWANFPIVVNVIKGTNALNQSRLEKCYDYYDEAYAYANELNQQFSGMIPSGCTLFTSGNNTLVNQFVALNKLNGPYKTGQKIVEYYGDNVPPRLAGIKVEYDKIAAAYEVLNKGFEDYYNAIGENGTATYGGLMNVIDTAVAKNDFPTYIVNYFKFLVVQETDQDINLALELMDNIITDKPDAFWLYAANAISLYKQSGDFDKALSICNEILKTDPTNAATIASSMSVLRMDKNYTGALSVYNKAMDVIETTPEIERQRAIILMLQGDYKTAESLLIKNFDESTVTKEYAETLCACALKTGNTDKFDEVCQFLAKYGVQLSESIQQLQAGKTTIEKIYLEGAGEPV